MKLPCLFQFRVLKLALTSLLSRPFTTRFPAGPYQPIPQFRGRPRYHKDDCIGCGACAQVCPADAIAPLPYQVHEVDMGKCVRCHACYDICPAGAVKVE